MWRRVLDRGVRPGHLSSIQGFHRGIVEVTPKRTLERLDVLGARRHEEVEAVGSSRQPLGSHGHRADHHQLGALPLQSPQNVKSFLERHPTSVCAARALRTPRLYARGAMPLRAKRGLSATHFGKRECQVPDAPIRLPR